MSTPLVPRASRHDPPNRQHLSLRLKPPPPTFPFHERYPKGTAQTPQNMHPNPNPLSSSHQEPAPKNLYWIPKIPQKIYGPNQKSQKNQRRNTSINILSFLGGLNLFNVSGNAHFQEGSPKKKSPSGGPSTPSRKSNKSPNS